MMRYALFGFLVLLFCGCAHAGPHQGGPVPFEALDLNHDGSVSREEADQAPCLSRDFDDLDTNRDGVLSRDELPGPPEGDRPGRGPGGFGPDGGHGGPGHGPGGQHGTPPSCDDLDADHDGVLTRDEVARDPFLSRDFDKLDVDHDGRLTREELPAPPQGGKPPRQ